MPLNYTGAIRDPIHNYIRVTDAETDLINSTFLQRLRWVSQLSGVRMVFPGAMHSRLAHVLGVAQLAGEYAEQIYKDDNDQNYKIQLARLGGLLHDVGHGPYSHAYDDTVYRDLYPGNMHGHDTHRFKIIESDFVKPFIEATGVELKDLVGLWKGEDKVMQAITQGAIGADRVDFMLRDGYYAGTTHFGTVAVKRIIDNARIADHDGSPSLHYNLKVLEDIFQALLGRFYMYRGVYFNKTSAASDILIRKLLSAAKDPLDLVSRTDNLEDYQWVNEYTLMGEIFGGKSEELKEAKYYAKRLMARKLPKLVWEITLPESQVIAITGDLERDSQTIARGRIIEKIEDEADRRGIERPELYVVNTYPMSTIDHQELSVGKIFLYDDTGSLEAGRHSFTLQEAIEKTTYFQSFLSGVQTGRERYVMIRVFSDAKDSDWIRKFVKTETEDGVQPNISETSY